MATGNEEVSKKTAGCTWLRYYGFNMSLPRVFLMKILKKVQTHSQYMAYTYYAGRFKNGMDKNSDLLIPLIHRFLILLDPVDL